MMLLGVVTGDSASIMSVWNVDPLVGGLGPAGEGAGISVSLWG